MEITINRSAEHEKTLIKLVWKQSLIKHCLLILVMLLCGLLLLFMKVKINDFEPPFWNFGSAIALGFIMIGISRLITLSRLHSTLVNSSFEQSIIVLNEEMIFYRKLDVEIKYEWSYFKFYQIKGNLIIFKKELKQPQVFIIDRNEISPSELNFINNQVLKKKIIKK